MVLGRIDAVAHKHNRRIDVGGSLPCLILGHDLVAIRKIERRAIGRHKAEFRLVLHRVHRVQRNALEVRAVVAGRFNARKRELRGDVLRRQLASACPRTATFQQVERQKSHVRANLLAIDRRRRGARPGRQPGNFRYRILRRLLRRDSQSSRGQNGRCQKSRNNPRMHGISSETDCSADTAKILRATRQRILVETLQTTASTAPPRNCLRRGQRQQPRAHQHLARQPGQRHARRFAQRNPSPLSACHRHRLHIVLKHRADAHVIIHLHDGVAHASCAARSPEHRIAAAPAAPTSPASPSASAGRCSSSTSRVPGPRRLPAAVLVRTASA